MISGLLPLQSPEKDVSSERPDEYPPAVADRWEALLEDSQATAAEYRDQSWDVLVIHPGDVTPLTDDPFGLDVLVPSSEFEALQDLVENLSFDRTTVYSAEEGDARLYIVVPEAHADEQAVVIPAFLSLAELPGLEQVARNEGVMYTHVRTPSADVRVTFRHDDPSLFF